MIKKIFKENLFYIITIIALIILFYIIKNNMIGSFIQTIDNSVIESIKNIADDNLIDFMTILTKIGATYLPIGIILVLFFSRSNNWYSYISAFSLGFSGIIAVIVKNIIMRPRPVWALIEIPKNYSFPSGHTLVSFVFYFTLCYLLTFKINKYHKRTAIIMTLIFVGLIGFSRIYLGVHFLSDVIGGIIFAIPTVLMIINIVEKNFKEKLK